MTPTDTRYHDFPLFCAGARVQLSACVRVFCPQCQRLCLAASCSSASDLRPSLHPSLPPSRGLFDYWSLGLCEPLADKFVHRYSYKRGGGHSYTSNPSPRSRDLSNGSCAQKEHKIIREHSRSPFPSLPEQQCIHLFPRTAVMRESRGRSSRLFKQIQSKHEGRREEEEGVGCGGRLNKAANDLGR